MGFGREGLLCHAARHYGVQAHGIRLSENQLLYTQEEVCRLVLKTASLWKSVTIPVSLEGEFDKVGSICMYEDVGIASDIHANPVAAPSRSHAEQGPDETQKKVTSNATAACHGLYGR